MHEWSESQLMIRDTVRQFVENEIAPHVEDLEHGERKAHRPPANNKNGHGRCASLRFIRHGPRVSLMRGFCQWAVGAWTQRDGVVGLAVDSVFNSAQAENWTFEYLNLGAERT